MKKNGSKKHVPLPTSRCRRHIFCKNLSQKKSRWLAWIIVSSKHSQQYWPQYWERKNHFSLKLSRIQQFENWVYFSMSRSCPVADSTNLAITFLLFDQIQWFLEWYIFVIVSLCCKHHILDICENKIDRILY